MTRASLSESVEGSSLIMRDLGLRMILTISSGVAMCLLFNIDP
jgi:hypothetical protein